MRKSPQIIVDHSKLTEGFIEPTETVFIVGRGDKSGIRTITTDSPALYVQQFGRSKRPRMWRLRRFLNRQLTEYYTVGDSLACATVLLTLFAITLAVWAS